MRPLKIIFLVALALASLGFLIAGYRNFRLFVQSQGYIKAEIHLEKAGTFSINANPPGRSFFRPGGIVQIFLKGQGIERFNITNGQGNLKVTDLLGNICLEQDLAEFALVESNETKFLMGYREFNTSHGGPYNFEFSILRPFWELEGVHQTLRVSHFVCGNEVLLHLLQFGGSILCVAAFLVLLFRCRSKSKVAIP